MSATGRLPVLRLWNRRSAPPRRPSRHCRASRPGPGDGRFPRPADAGHPAPAVHQMRRSHCWNANSARTDLRGRRSEMGVPTAKTERRSVIRSNDGPTPSENFTHNCSALHTLLLKR
jgi:hypothetical protein